MGSVLSSDSGKSAPASAAPRALERKGDPELPVTSFDCSVCLEVLHQPVRTRCGHVCVCPFCQRELDEDSLLDHCITHHRSERRSVFCPLCRLLPNENPGSFSGSLIRHLQVSHTLFYDDFIDFNIIEEALIRRVLDRSLLEYVNHSNTT
ncbi:E3 ubiquitin-protein ligase RNF125 [Leptonychotes weddellii]|uniref:E3 ubiquitin-protein ligase RNF125 n=1 Tax=Leptonychotes weddellii TaxID=9713 RepID=A0A7F8RQQ5_LEPWE|nr:E3 ubiquitin-protein ligase RNF125 [Leptonychotes weddellii]